MLAEAPASAAGRLKGHDAPSHQKVVDRRARGRGAPAQAAHFVRNGGGWTADGWALPPALDIEHNPYDGKRRCYGLSKAGRAGWIASFGDEIERLTGRRPVLCTTTRWWNTCTGGSSVFAAGHTL